MNSEYLKKLVTVPMPYGKYSGRIIADLPGNYLNWFARKGFPQGELGQLHIRTHHEPPFASIVNTYYYRT